DGGAQEVLLGADGAGGIVSTMTNHDLQLRAGAMLPGRSSKPMATLALARMHQRGSSMSWVIVSVWRMLASISTCVRPVAPSMCTQRRIASTCAVAEVVAKTK